MSPTCEWRHLAEMALAWIDGVRNPVIEKSLSELRKQFYDGRGLHCAHEGRPTPAIRRPVRRGTDLLVRNQLDQVRPLPGGDVPDVRGNGVCG